MGDAPQPTTYAALRAYHECIEGMLTDPDLGGDLLLIGLYMARRVHLGKRVVGEATAEQMVEAIFGQAEHVRGGRADRYRRAMRDDIRCYDYRQDPTNNPGRRHYRDPCAAPMIRRCGPCGKPSNTWRLLTDPETGRRIGFGACSRHAEWEREQVAANRAALEAVGEHLPVPPANTGGVLRRHLPDFDWPAYWAKIEPTWKEPPEETPVAKPRLLLVITDDFEPDDAPVPARPALSLVPPAK